ncbi:hypothetical protein [Photorhabdus heterorhabditis]|uniref:Uncharacterized protein n=1 Tax=Photorhabdus heterorhabditis TaxID=880156 RepID=A0A5B0WRZ6_9GAMM|nr:hypothetical protein [Photorhabdus heterorhabditis]KAA1189830.1 hypothetical protein F0L16_09955 [Photorhabdus heterorhabditis]KOY62021.1 hypothetical protein AM629_10860 [Photorhabdus heterorhabditis]MBS9442021.1 hypothetical protein [Photorhabdus heterorhabditis]
MLLRIPVISNVTAQPYGSADIAEKLVQQLTQPERWQSSIQFIYRHGPMFFIEPGAKTVLSKPMPSLLVRCSSYEITL